MLKKLLKVLNFLDPLLIYVALIYGLSKVYESIFQVESVWQGFWDKLQALLGEFFFNANFFPLSHSSFWAISLLRR